MTDPPVDKFALEIEDLSHLIEYHPTLGRQPFILIRFPARLKANATEWLITAQMGGGAHAERDVLATALRGVLALLEEGEPE